MLQRAPLDEQPNDSPWWHWRWWYPAELLPDDAPSAPLASGFAGATLTLAVVATLAGVIPLILFIGWAVAPHVSPTP
jgi:hypothetical protein